MEFVHGPRGGVAGGSGGGSGLTDWKEAPLAPWTTFGAGSGPTDREGAPPAPGPSQTAHNWWWHATRVINTFAGGQEAGLHHHRVSDVQLPLGRLACPRHEPAISDTGSLYCIKPVPVRRYPGCGLVAPPPRWRPSRLLFSSDPWPFINLWDLPLIAAVLGVVVADQELQRTQAATLQWAAHQDSGHAGRRYWFCR